MCGICGQVNADRSRPVDQRILDKMNSVLVHRGPDSSGRYLNENVGLAVRRLAVVDLVTGDQPITNETGKVHIVFNGEIYNNEQLRPQLIARGHSIRSNRDYIRDLFPSPK